jgi:hypothetical protein
LLRGHIFPRKRTLGTDFGAKCRIWENSDFTIYLSIGFGEALEWPAQVVIPHNFIKFSTQLLHEHVVYKWHGYDGLPTERIVKKEWVFPALLTHTKELKAAVDKHLTRLIDNRLNFARFPVYESPLVVLKHIYEFYLKLGETEEEVSSRISKRVKASS